MLAPTSQKEGQTPSQSKKRERFFFQPKLTINQPNNVYEQEADAVADKVMRMPETPSLFANNKPFFSPPTVNINKTVPPKEELQKKENKEEEAEEPLTAIQARLSFDGLPEPPNDKTSIQRKCAHCEEEEKKLQRKEINNDETIADLSIENYIGSINGKGRSLTSNERKFFEPRMGYDFSNVQLHTNEEATQSAKSINALAYTHGNNIVFGSNQYQPNTDDGKKLMAHELTHVAQQSGSAPTVQRQPIASGPEPRVPIASGPNFTVTPINVDEQNGAVTKSKKNPNLTITPINDDEEGGAAIGHIEDDMHFIILEWKIAADQGVDLFATNNLSQRIDSTESGNVKNFLLSLIGNTIWAATVVMTEGATSVAGRQFVVSMEGILLGSIPTIPHHEETPLAQMKRIMGAYINKIYDGLNKQLPHIASKILEDYPGISRYYALGSFINANFPDFANVDKNYKTKGELNKDAISDKYAQITSKYWTEYRQQVEPIGKKSKNLYSEGKNELVFIKVGSQKVLTLVRVFMGIREFISFIDKEMAKSAISKAIDEQDQIDTFDASSKFLGVPNQIPANAFIQPNPTH